MTSNIETGFIPTTVNEVLLLERIHQLRIESYKHRSYDFDPVVSNDDMMPVRQITPILYLAADLKAGWQNDRRYHIDAVARLPDKQSLHIGHYLSEEMLSQWTPRAAAQELGKLHLAAIKNIAASIKEPVE